MHEKEIVLANSRDSNLSDLKFSWEPNVDCEGELSYDGCRILIKKSDGSFHELICIENKRITNIIIPNVECVKELHIKVVYYIRIKAEMVILKTANYYAFSSNNRSIVYRYPTPQDLFYERMNDKVLVHWEPIDAGIKYIVMRKSVGKDWEQIAIVDDTQFEDDKILATRKYVYSVRCISQYGEFMSGRTLMNKYV